MNRVKGNLITLAEEGLFDVIVHGCNCKCKMGAGIAKQIATRYPAAYQADLTTQKGDQAKLGGFTWVRVTSPQGHSFIIVNGYTQLDYGSDGEFVNYTAIRSVFQLVKWNWPYAVVGYPYIGAGLGGGNWDRIAPCIDAELAGMIHYVVQYRR